MVLYSLVIKSPLIFAAKLSEIIITTKENRCYFVQKGLKNE